jgi:hypothetical protein
MTAEYHKGRIKEYMDRRDYASAIRECDLYFRCCEPEPAEANALSVQWILSRGRRPPESDCELNKALEMPQCSRGTSMRSPQSGGCARSAGAL